MHTKTIVAGFILILFSIQLYADPAVQGDPKAPVSTALTGAEHGIPAGVAPAAGAEVYGVMFSRLQSDVRVVAFDGNRVLGTAWNNSPNNIGLFGAPLGPYTGSNFAFRVESFDNGQWVPVSAPMTVVNAACAYGDPKTLYDRLNLRFGQDRNKPDVRLLLSWGAPNVVLQTEAKHNPHNFVVVQEATNYAKAYLTMNGQPYPAATISVHMAYKGNTVFGDPFKLVQGANGSSGGPHPASGDAPYGQSTSPFPYSGNLTKTEQNTDQVTVGDQNHSTGFPTAINVTSDFTAEGAAVLMDGRTIYSSVDSGN